MLAIFDLEDRCSLKFVDAEDRQLCNQASLLERGVWDSDKKLNTKERLWSLPEKEKFYQNPPKRAGKLVLHEKCRKLHWRFLTFFAMREKCRKVSDFLNTLSLTFFDVAPFRWPLLQSAEKKPKHRKCPEKVSKSVGFSKHSPFDVVWRGPFPLAPFAICRKKLKHRECPANLDGQNRQSPIASDFGSRTQIAALFAVLLYPNV